MGFADGEILLDSPTGAYYAGQFVKARLVFELTKVKKVRGIFAKVKGFCDVHWTTEHTRRVNDRTEHYTVDHKSYEEYINLKIYLVGSKNDEINLNPGKHEYPFGFQVPDCCPSSFEGTRGHIRYVIKVVADRPFAVDQEKLRDFKVYAPLDLNRANCNEPVNFEFYQSFCCWCIRSGSSETIVKLPVRGYCPGQIIPVEISCKNASSVYLNGVNLIIKKEIKYRAETNQASEIEHETLLEMIKGPIPAHTDRNWTVELSVPMTDAPNMNSCSFIDINYEFKAIIEPSGCHNSEEDSCSLIFGSIPIAGFQDDYKHPLQDQMPQINVVPQNQYPVNQPHYPTAVTNQPMPAISPYPSNSPYPNPQPYPGPNLSPAPYPQPNGAYPGGISSPNQLPNGYQPSPYPSPQPSGSPYPTRSPAPYPPAPGVAGTTPLKTGNFGFNVAADDHASIPLLPTGAVPYPISSPNAPNPYATASAPQPGTPDHDLQNLRTSNNSPYNPEFKEEGKD